MSSALASQTVGQFWQGEESLVPQMVLRGPSSSSLEDNSSFSGDFLRDIEHQLESDRIEFELEINSLKRSYVLVKPEQVIQYIRDHRTLPSLLNEAAPKLKECFGADTVIQLELGSAGDESPTLRVLAMWPGSLASANAALRAFDESFWIANCDRASGNLVIDRELV
jgi:hypothetical protein